MLIPSLLDPSLAPPGKHIMSIFVQYAPYALSGADGDWDAQRDAFGDTVIRTLAEYAPNLPDIVLERQVLTPLDIERRTRAHRRQHLPGGNSGSSSSSSCGRPPAGRNSGPRPGGSSCAGSGAHPGGGVMGAPGKLGAEAMLRAAGAG